MLTRRFSTQAARLADFSHVVIGAGVVGLAIGAQLAAKGANVIVIEKNSSHGQETSSRNSEVVHAGLYYPKDSLKTKMCIRGNHLIHGLKDLIPVHQCGKWIVAQNEQQHEYLEALHEKSKDLGIPTEFLNLDKAKLLEPKIRAQNAILYSPSTSVTSAHDLMNYLLAELENNDGELALGTEVTGITKNGNEWEIETKADGEDFVVSSEVVINSAGLYAPHIANMVLEDGEKQYESFYAKGNYFTWTGPNPGISRLIYPCPTPGVKSLGTHLTIDLGGQVRFGPDLEWVDRIEYNVNNKNATAAKKAVAEYFPGVVAGDLVGTYSGIRPKLQGPEGETQDFIIRVHSDPTFISMLGIESPGLTASLALAEYVSALV